MVSRKTSVRSVSSIPASPSIIIIISIVIIIIATTIIVNIVYNMPVPVLKMSTKQSTVSHEFRNIWLKNACIKMVYLGICGL